MSISTKELICKSYQVYNDGLTGSMKEKLEMIASQFETVESFLKANKQDFEKLVFKVGRKKFKLTNDDFNKLESLRNSGLLDGSLSNRDNYIDILINQFISRQEVMIEKMTLNSLNVNPILVGALNLNNELDLIRFYVYQAVSRSMVTSVGYLVQNLLLYSGDSISDGKFSSLGNSTKWDLVIERKRRKKVFIEVKSGTNDLNKSQVLHFEKEIYSIEELGYRAYIGETYGKRMDNTITHGLYKQYLPDWGKRTLIGKELWEFVSGEKEYHLHLIKSLFKSSEKLLSDQTFIDKIEKKIESLILEFQRQNESFDKYLSSLW